jgi:hypothetical protein
MFKVAYELIKDFGAFGVGIIQLGIIGFFGYKLFSNHLKHITDKINSLCKRFGIIEGEIKEHGEKIAKIEGKLEK